MAHRRRQQKAGSPLSGVVSPGPAPAGRLTGDTFQRPTHRFPWLHPSPRRPWPRREAPAAARPPAPESWGPAKRLVLAWGAAAAGSVAEKRVPAGVGTRASLLDPLRGHFAWTKEVGGRRRGRGVSVPWDGPRGNLAPGWRTRRTPDLDVFSQHVQTDGQQPPAVTPTTTTSLPPPPNARLQCMLIRFQPSIGSKGRRLNGGCRRQNGGCNSGMQRACAPAAPPAAAPQTSRSSVACFTLMVKKVTALPCGKKTTGQRYTQTSSHRSRQPQSQRRSTRDGVDGAEQRLS